MTDRKLMQQALEALEGLADYRYTERVKATMSALRERLAQPEQKSVAWVDVKDAHHGPYEFHGKELLPVGKHDLFTAPPQRKPLPKSEWPKHPSPYVNDQYMGYSKSDLDDYAMQVLAAHGIKENA